MDAPMRRKSFADMSCSLAGALEIVGEWWTLLIVRDALMGQTRFEGWQASLGISRNVLAARLRRLVGTGVLERVRYRERPVRHEYRLTEKGRGLGVALMALTQWGDAWDTSGCGQPPARFVRVSSGAPLEARIVDTETGDAVGPEEVGVMTGPADGPPHRD